ncbi:MAG: phosphonate metabolism protein/1,5-bisphosphokinase (PRPP-forming) PhnN [Roseivivax sp.]|nr:phosphonate metabolism protein/1,5-bisphosphokinase (PRPP-forming) PhnN [Roseivivax sp.]
MAGRLIAIVGPSGVGKDSVLAGLLAADPGLCAARRVITRAPEPGGEDHEPVDEAEFHRRRAAGAFSLSWGAHGLYYGIGVDVPDQVAAGAQVLANLSRGVLAEAGTAFAALTVLHVTAEPTVLAARLRARGREDDAGIAARLSRSAKPLPAGLDIRELRNDGTLAEAVSRARALLQPVRA